MTEAGDRTRDPRNSKTVSIPLRHRSLWAEGSSPPYVEFQSKSISFKLRNARMYGDVIIFVGYYQFLFLVNSGKNH